MKEWKLEGEQAAEKGAEAPVSPEEAKEARNKAVYYLQFSSKTEYELRQKLAEQGFSPASVSHAVEFVKKRRYLDDREYAVRYLERNCYKKSRKQMVFELRQKGIGEEVLDAALEEMPVDEKTQIRKLLEKKHFQGEEAGWEEKKKLLGYLARKGFSFEAVQAAMDCWEDG